MADHFEFDSEGDSSLDLFKDFIDDSSAFNWTLGDQLSLLIEQIMDALEEMPEEERQQKIAWVFLEIDGFLEEFLSAHDQQMPEIFRDYLDDLSDFENSDE